MLEMCWSIISLPTSAALRLYTPGISVKARKLNKYELTPIRYQGISLQCSGVTAGAWHAGERRSSWSAASNVSTHTSSTLYMYPPE